MSLWNAVLSRLGHVGVHTARGRRANGVKPSCEPLDARQLLSTAPVSLPAPPPSAVAIAAAALQKVSPTVFASFATGLARAAEHSHVTQAQVSKLAQDEAIIEQGISSSGLIPLIKESDINEAQYLIAQAFIMTTEPSIDWVSQEEQLYGTTGGTKVDPVLISQTTKQMYVVARAAGVSAALTTSLEANIATLEQAVGPNPNIDFGPGVTATDPVAVYYEGQIAKFVH